MYQYNPSSFAFMPVRGRLRPFSALLGRLALWSERRRQRQALSRLDDRMLKDVGLSRADVGRETAKPFWE